MVVWQSAEDGSTEIGYFQKPCTFFKRSEVGPRFPNRATISKNGLWGIEFLMADVISNNCRVLKCNK